MTTYYADPFVTLLQGDVREVLRSLPAESVQTCVTSPPYWSLRDYGIPPSVWGDEDGCEHEWVANIAGESYTGQKRWQHSSNGENEGKPPFSSRGDYPEVWQKETKQGDTCARCGAWRGALGLEPTPDLFVAHIVAVFHEVRRVLRPDGTCWVNLGDSYAGSPSGSFGQGGKPGDGGSFRSNKAFSTAGVSGLKPKDLVGIPWMVAFALRADGWYLRQDIIWAKPNPMPESVTDRCTKAHEYLFLLSKSGRYYYDADAVREAPTGRTDPITGFGGVAERNDGRRSYELTGDVGRNKRSVWNIPTAPFPEAHFATFPPDLVKPCVLAGSSEMGCCAECGAPWVREVESEYSKHRPSGGKASRIERGNKVHDDGFGSWGTFGTNLRKHVSTIGWARTCAHDAPAVPCTVLDPFVGSGTTAMVAKKWGRKAIGIDLSADYLAMAQERVQAVTLPMFAGLQ